VVNETTAPMMNEITIGKSALAAAFRKGADAYLEMLVNATKDAVGGELDADAMDLLNADQLTMIAYDILRSEVMDGGFVQLIHNGYGAFMFLNPVAKVMKLWGLRDLAKLLQNGRKLYFKHKEGIEHECTDDEFMALFEQFPEFDDLDDEFVENEEEWTNAVARYANEHIGNFAKIV